MKKNIWKYLSLAVMGLLIIMACSMGDVHDVIDGSNAPLQPLPPTFIGKNVTLVENTWHLLEANHNGEMVKFDAIAPITLQIGRDGYFAVWTTDCNFFSYKIITKSKQHYRLMVGDSTLRGCSPLRERQLENISNVLESTTSYKIEGNRLFLTGPNVQMILEIEAAIVPPNSPVATPMQP